MTKWVKTVGIFLMLMLLIVFSFGCAGMARETKIKCPKCGTIFPVSEKRIGNAGGP